MLKHKHFAKCEQTRQIQLCKIQMCQHKKKLSTYKYKHNAMKVQEGSGNTNEQLDVFRAHSLPGC